MGDLTGAARSGRRARGGGARTALVLGGGVLLLVALSAVLVPIALRFLMLLSGESPDEDADRVDRTLEVCGIDADERQDLEELFVDSVHAGLGIDDHMSPFQNCYLNGDYVVQFDVERVEMPAFGGELLVRIEPFGWAPHGDDFAAVPASDVLFVQEPTPPAGAILSFEPEGDAVSVTMTVSEP